MTKLIKPKKISGKLNAPPSKSMMLRALAAGILGEDEIEISNPSYCADAQAAIEIAETLNCEIHKEKQLLTLKKKSNNFTIPDNVKLDCNESGLCMRLFPPIAALFGTEIEITGSEALLKRPVSMLEAPLRGLGVKCTSNNGFPPVTVKGPYSKNEAHVDASISSQFLSGLLMALPLLNYDSKIFVRDLKSKPYIDMTLELLNDFKIDIENENYEHFNIKGSQKYKKEKYTIEGDWSGAAFFIVAAAISGEIELHGLSLTSKQADKAILEAIMSAGANVKYIDDRLIIKSKTLNAFDFDLTDCPDLFPILAVLASHAKGTSTFYGVERIRFKESDRIAAIEKELQKLGANIDVHKDKVLIKGSKLDGAVKINPHNDHRIAMAAAIAGLNTSTGLSIQDPSCVEKSYINFFEDLEKLGKG